jgi:hypothetical protein
MRRTANLRLLMLIRYRSGMMHEAVMLSLAGGTMRVALKDEGDVTEFRLVSDTWISESGDPVTFDFTIAILAAVGIVPPADGPDETAAASLAPGPRDFHSSFSQSVN